MFVGNMRRDFVPRILGFAETVVPQYSNDDFRKHFRISRAVFDQILQEIAPTLTTENSGGTEGTTPEKQLLVFIWYMSNLDSIRELANMFGMSMSTVHSIIYKLHDIFEQDLAHVSYLFCVSVLE